MQQVNGMMPRAACADQALSPVVAWSPAHLLIGCRLRLRLSLPLLMSELSGWQSRTGLANRIVPNEKGLRADPESWHNVPGWRGWGGRVFWLTPAQDVGKNADYRTSACPPKLNGRRSDGEGGAGDDARTSGMTARTQEDYPLLSLGGRTVQLPITDVGIYRDAYHATSLDEAKSIERNGFRPSSRGWYGPGVYFWLHNIRVAVWWAKEFRGFKTNYAVVKCVVDPGKTLHAEQLWDDEVVMAAMREARRTVQLPSDWTSEDERSWVVYAVLCACQDAKVQVDALQFTRRTKASTAPVQALCVHKADRIRNRRVLGPADLQ